MQISVVIPTYKRPDTTRQAVQSIIDGEYADFEIIVVDQSPDHATEEALATFERDGRVRYIRAAKPGASAARNRGIIASRGQIIALTDDDVEARPDWLARIAAEFAADPELQFISGALIAPEYDRAAGYIPEFMPYPEISGWHLVLMAANANFSMRRELFDRIGGYDELCGPGGLLKSSDDGDIVLRIVRSGARWKAAPEIAVVHTHGFRPKGKAEALLADYAYGNGAIFGRAARRGDLIAGAWFIARELKRLALNRQGIGLHLNHLRGFWHGLRLSPKVGFVSGGQLRSRRLAPGGAA